MEIRLILKAILFLSLKAIGIPGNLIILGYFAHFRIFTGKLIPADTILFKLSFINLLVVLIRGIPQSLSTLGIQRLFNQQGCCFVIFPYRVCRAMSISMTSLMSCYQNVLLAPSTTYWTTIKKMLVQNLLSITLFFWCLNMTIHLFAMYSFSWGLYLNSTIHVLNLEFCLIIFPSYTDFLIITLSPTVRDLICIGLMSISSVYIVMILYQHMRRVKSIQSTKWNGGSNAEIKAANAVVMLVSMYLCFFGLDNAIGLFSNSTSTSISLELTDARVFFASCYSALSLLEVIATNKKVQLKLKYLP
ncbi:olfactory receptor class A-like protein 1 [Lissotriton helveticus]